VDVAVDTDSGGMRGRGVAIQTARNRAVRRPRISREGGKGAPKVARICQKGHAAHELVAGRNVRARVQALEVGGVEAFECLGSRLVCSC
jgi:hypothetical protein